MARFPKAAARIGILVPAFNSSAQPEMEAMRVPGVTNHVARIDMPNTPLTSDANQAEVVAQIGPDLPAAIRRVSGVAPNAIILGISIGSFWRGVAGGRALREELQRQCSVPFITADDAMLAALGHLPEVRRLGLITPFQPAANARIGAFFTEAGFAVDVIHSTEATSGLSIADLPEERIVATIKTVAASPCDAVLQVGTNLATAQLMDEAERWLGKPCLSVNAALYWRALRLCGIETPLEGCGSVFARA